MTHDTKCMQEASIIMGRAGLHSCYVFVHDAVNWLSAHGELTIAKPDDWLVRVEGHIASGGYSLEEALCGAIHAIASQPTE